MIQVRKIDTHSRKDVNRFVEFHYKLYRNKCPQWVPPFYQDIKMMLNRDKHPFYLHSDADFFVAEQDGEIVGRVAIMENRPYNQYHSVKKAQFYLFDTINDQEVVNALFEKSFEWCRQRGLNEVVGPKGFSPFDGYGILVEGFEHRQMMTMMNYNYDYYPTLLEGCGFTKEVDFVSCYMHKDKFHLPDKVHEIARRVKERGTFEVKRFDSKRELMSWANRIGHAYNQVFVNNWEYYPLTDQEIKFQLDSILMIADPKLIKIILHKGDVVGFLLAFPDLSAALQRQGGRITPWGVVDLMLEMKRTKWVSLNGMGVLPQYHGLGGNALLYSEMAHTIYDYKFIHAEQTQMADTAVQVRRDMINLGADIYKSHRIFHRTI